MRSVPMAIYLTISLYGQATNKVGRPAGVELESQMRCLPDRRNTRSALRCSYSTTDGFPLQLRQLGVLRKTTKSVTQ